MASKLVDFANLLFAALVAGALFGIWLSFNPEGLAAGAYIAQQQHGIRTLNVTMPLLGGVTILLTIAAALLARSDRTRLTLLVSAAACFVVSGLITRFLNQPINAIVMTWSPDVPPSNWMQLRDDWWRWHVLRTAVGIGGLSLVILAALRRTGS
jgi:uncharacterized membrane protein